MPLVLSLKEGDDFYIGDEQFFVKTVTSETSFKVVRSATGKAFDITDTRATEIMDDVYLSAGERLQVAMARVAIEAPRSIRVLRGEKYRNPPPHVANK